MKSTLSLLLTILTFSVFAQSKWQIGISFSPDLSFRDLTRESDSQDAYQTYVYRGVYEEPMLAYTTGVHVIYGLKKLKLETGILFSKKGYKHKKGGYAYGGSIDTRRGFIYPYNAYYGASYQYSYLDVPINGLFYVGNGKLKPIIGGGVALNILLQSQQTFTDIRDGKMYTLVMGAENQKLVNLSAQLFVGLDYSFKENWRLRLKPIYRYSLNKVYKQTDVNHYLYSYGLELGVFKSF